MLIKIGLTVVLVIAIGLYYVADKNVTFEILGRRISISDPSLGELPLEIQEPLAHSPGGEIQEPAAQGSQSGDGGQGHHINIKDTEKVKTAKHSDANDEDTAEGKPTLNSDTKGAEKKDSPEKKPALNSDAEATEKKDTERSQGERVQNALENDQNKRGGTPEHAKQPVDPEQNVNNNLLHEHAIDDLESKSGSANGAIRTDQSADKTGPKTEETASQQDSKVETDGEHMHFAIVACGDRMEETIVVIKSALIFSRAFITLHIFADDDLQPQFREQLGEFPAHVQKKFDYHIYDIQFPAGTKPDEWRKLFKTCATQRLFIPDILTDVEKLIYVDTDILFLRPIDDVWAMFKEFNSTQLAALAWEHEDGTAGWYNRFARHPYYPPFGVNSGIMLMDLPKIRAANWTALMIEYFREYKYKITWGDQDLINIFFHYYPEKLYVFSCPYNYRPDHCMYMQTCKKVLNTGVSVLHGCRRVFHNEKQVSFRAVYLAFEQYKWEWPLDAGLLKVVIQNQNKVAGSADRCMNDPSFFTKQLRQSIKDIKS